MFALHEVLKVYAERPALGPLTLTAPPGRTTVLIGPSGCGKSTFLRLLIGLVEPDAGEVTFDGKPVAPATVRAVRLRVGYVIQDGGLFPHLTARGNVTLMARHLGRDRDTTAARVAELTDLTRFPAEGLDRYPHELSGGQRQRVGLMRALMLNPDALLLDESLGALDPLVRADLQAELRDIFRRLDKTVVLVTHDLAEAQMRRMNAAVQEGKRDEGTVASEFLRSELAVDARTSQGTLAQRVLSTTGEHLLLVIPSLLAAVLVGVPLGVIAARQPRLGRVVFAATGILQTIPSLALLLFMIPVMMWLVGKGTGAPPAIAALFLYSLLPIVRNTHAGLTGIPASLREAAEALGLPPLAVLWRIELPLATPTILAGVRTAAVINVGTATLGGFIGAGGYGGPILRGIDKCDVPLMLEGAVPAALLALVIEGLFELVQRSVPRHG